MSKRGRGCITAGSEVIIEAVIQFTPKVIEDIKQAFLFKFTKFTGVCVFSFEREAMSSSVPIDAKS